MYKAKRFYTIKNITNIYRINSTKAFNLKQIIDMFSGLKECIDLAEKLHLYKLYETSINRLNLNMLLKGAKKFSEDKALKNLIYLILKSKSNNYKKI